MGIVRLLHTPRRGSVSHKHPNEDDITNKAEGIESPSITPTNHE